MMTLRSSIRVISIVYLLVISYLLLTPDPLPRDEMLAGLMEWFEPVRHFVAMFLLALLVLASCWPLSLSWVVSLLIAYGVGIERLQAAFPPRTVEAVDLVQNVVGIISAVLVWWIAVAMVHCRRVPLDD